MGHHYNAHLIWDEQGGGTTSYDSYSRQYHTIIDGKPDLTGSADPTFRGDAKLHNPEDLLVIALSSCHMLSFLALCARKRIVVTAYEDHATGTMSTDKSGGGKFDEVVLHPSVTVAKAEDVARLEEIHEKAHELCFIASSCNFPVRHEATAKVAS